MDSDISLRVLQVPLRLKIMYNKMRNEVSYIVGFVSGSFPGIQPVSITKRNINLLNLEDYLVSKKADGERKLLYSNNWTTHFVSRKFHFEPCNLISTKYQTLLDGELVNENGIMRFLVYDAIMVNGEYLGDYYLSYRLHKATHVIHSNTKQIQLKLFFNMNEIENIYNKKFEHKTDGLIFTNKYSPYRGGRCETLLKYKDISDNTVDFKACHEENNIKLYIGIKGEPVYYVSNCNISPNDFFTKYPAL